MTVRVLPRSTSGLSREDAAQELLSRREARRSFSGFLQYSGGPIPAAHHQLIIDELESVVRGDCQRLMIFLPPGSAKSTYASVWFPSYYLSRNRENTVIAASHTADLAENFGRKVRNLVAGEHWRAVNAGGLNPEMKSVANWSTTLGGEYFAVGFTGNVTGRRADLLLIDDPIKGREDADSVRIRNKVWDAYKSDLRTRMRPGGAIIIIQTRWHEDDLAGRILPEDYDFRSGIVEARDGEQWRVISIPAIAEQNDVLGRSPGEALWPEWWPPGFLEQEKISQGPRNWAALYQQRPAPEEGDYFERGWIRYYERLPLNCRFFGFSDYAVDPDGGDYTVHGIVAVTDDLDDAFLVDWWRENAASDEWAARLVDMAIAYNVVAWYEEAGVIAKAVAPLIDQEQRSRRRFFHRKAFPSSADKPTRAQSIRGFVAQGKLLFPQDAPWVADLVAEMLVFPTGRYDDQVDVLSLIGRAMPEMIRTKPRGSRPSATRKPARYNPLDFRP